MRTLRALCSYTHPELSASDASPQQFRGLRDLRAALEAKGLHFCACCLEGRKVFISEQVAYSKTDLSRHMARGDESGPMADAGFRGHPMCKFCSKRFYSDQELYVHMQESHEQCFICKRVRPDKYVYFRDYRQLEGD